MQFRNWCRPKRQSSSWFSLKENHSSRPLPEHSNCETALVHVLVASLAEIQFALEGSQQLIIDSVFIAQHDGC
jgi:hypothetical protein